MDREGILDGNHTTATLLVDDIWRYFPTDNRKFGWQFKAGIGIDYEKIKEVTRTDSHIYELETKYPDGAPEEIDTLSETNLFSSSEENNKHTSSSTYLTLGGYYYKPFNHKWQLNISATGTYFLDYYREINNYDADLTRENIYSKYVTRYDYNDAYECVLNSEVRYIFSSRTTARVNFQSWYFSLDQDTKITDENNGSTDITNHSTETLNEFGFGISGSLTYRISIPLTLTTSVSYNNGASMPSRPGSLYNDIDGSNYGISARLGYYIW